MEAREIQKTIARGEDSSNQFKRNVTNADSLAQEMVAFSNSGGGSLIIGVDDDGTIVGLSSDDILRINQLVSSTADQNIRPAISPQTENVEINGAMVVVVHIQKGLRRPYQTNKGVAYVKSGSDKRIASLEELQRLFQASDIIHADELPVQTATVDDLDVEYFSHFYQRRYNEALESVSLSLPVLLHNMGLMKDGFLNLSGLLLFAKAPQLQRPAFIVKAVSFLGSSISDSGYLDSQDISGKLVDIYKQSFAFISRNIRHVQAGQGFNSLGQLEIADTALEELIVNALIHRDYFISAPVRIFIFTDRVEIINPGVLPNNLSIENIKLGISNMRNPILSSYATYLLPYRGIGSGIMRALDAYPDIEFVNDIEASQFKVIIKRQLIY